MVDIIRKVKFFFIRSFPFWKNCTLVHFASYSHTKVIQSLPFIKLARFGSKWSELSRSSIIQDRRYRITAIERYTKDKRVVWLMDISTGVCGPLETRRISIRRGYTFAWWASPCRIIPCFSNEWQRLPRLETRGRHEIRKIF